ncbi:hypothetical protein GCM10007860_12530 [Chitiniphilus shinanonensis]|uniref:DUF5666 domain-containing protein n=1 Tax=Chitiniphilus shinanonensis TaxID=553088 RepID=A0ABQ6BRM7_9NEIS|nr:hypothetical protein [Chitiniphilus shinanonensis]GLS04107.1 hypothetical protein GCM10007860_12530 [Chitiniphilus shinanonensis]
MKRILLATLLAAGLAAPLWAADDPIFLFEKSEKVRVQIVSVDHDRRVLTVRQPDGETAEFAVSPAVRNFDQLKEGDIAAVVLDRALAFDVVKGGNAPAQIKTEEGVGRNAEGEKPGATWETTKTITADVLAVNKDKGLVKLRGPKGRVLEMQVRDAARLNDIAIGDQVQVRYKQALAMWVEQAAQ